MEQRLILINLLVKLGVAADVSSSGRPAIPISAAPSALMGTQGKVRRLLNESASLVNAAAD